MKDLHNVFSRGALTNNFESYHYFLPLDWLLLLVPSKTAKYEDYVCSISGKLCIGNGNAYLKFSTITR